MEHLDKCLGNITYFIEQYPIGIVLKRQLLWSWELMTESSTALEESIRWNTNTSRFAFFICKYITARDAKLFPNDIREQNDQLALSFVLQLVVNVLAIRQ